MDAAHHYAGWVFVASPARRSAVHCTFNRIILRFYPCLVTTLALWFMAIRAALAYCAAQPAT
jgi:hypothetical protein